MLGLHLMCGLFSVAACGSYSLVAVCRLLPAADCCWGAQALRVKVSAVAASGLWSTGSVVVMHDLVAPSRWDPPGSESENAFLLHRQADSSPLSHQESPFMAFRMLNQGETLEIKCVSHSVVSDSVRPCRL